MESNNHSSEQANRFLVDILSNNKEDVKNVTQKQKKIKGDLDILIRVSFRIDECQNAKLNLLGTNLRKLLPQLIEQFLNEEEQQNKLKKLINTIKK